jgi:hypothetical protein
MTISPDVQTYMEKWVLIQAQMKKYKAEQEKVDLEEKVAWLQKTGGGVANAKQQDESAKATALIKLNAIIKSLEDKPLYKTPGFPAATPAPPRRRAAKIISGRRFR